MAQPCCHFERFLTTFALIATLRYPGPLQILLQPSLLTARAGESSSRQKNEFHVCFLLFSRPKSSHKRELNAKKREERQQRPEESRAVCLGVVGQLWLTGGSGRPRVNNGRGQFLLFPAGFAFHTEVLSKGKKTASLPPGSKNSSSSPSA